MPEVPEAPTSHTGVRRVLGWTSFLLVMALLPGLASGLLGWLAVGVGLLVAAALLVLRERTFSASGTAAGRADDWWAIPASLAGLGATIVVVERAVSFGMHGLLAFGGWLLVVVVALIVAAAVREAKREKEAAATDQQAGATDQGTAATDQQAATGRQSATTRGSPEMPDVSLGEGCTAAVVALAVVVGSLLIAHSRLSGDAEEILAAGVEAHAAGDCETAVAELRRFHLGHVLTFRGDILADVNDERDRCELLLDARAAAGNGSYVDALTRYATYAGEVGVVDIGPELSDLYGELVGRMESDAYCDAVAAVGLLAGAPAGRGEAAEPEVAAELAELDVFGALRDSAGADHPVALLECAKTRYAADGLADAGPLVIALRRNYPDHALGADNEDFVQGIVEEVTVRDIRQATGGAYEPLGPAEQYAGAAPVDGERVELRLGLLPVPLGRVDVLYAGPVTGQVSILEEGCLDGDWRELELPPGEYEILVRSAATDDAPPPLYGTWDLRAGTGYRGCFDYRVERDELLPTPPGPGD